MVSNQTRDNGVDPGPQLIHLTRLHTTHGDELSKRSLGTYAEYRRMRKHPTVALARALVIAPVVAGSWTIEADDDVPDQQVEFIQAQIMPHREQIVEQAMRHRVDYGWGAWEKQYEIKPVDGINRVCVKRIKNLLPDFTYILIDGYNGDFEGFRQHPTQDRHDYAVVTRRYALLVAWEVEGDEYYGRPLLENIRHIHTGWLDCNAGAERYDRKMAGAQWVVHYPQGTSTKDGEENVKNSVIAASIINALEASGSVSLPRKVKTMVTNLNDASKDDNAWQIELKDHSPKQHSFVDRLKYLDTQIARGLLVPERSAMEGQFGTKAEAGEHIDFAMTQRELDHAFITRQVNDQIVDDLVALNFGENQRGKIRLVTAPLIDQKLMFFREVYKLLLQHPTASLDAIDSLDTDALMDATGVPKGEEVVEVDGTPLANGGTSRPRQPGLDINNELAASVQRMYEQAIGDAE